ncbi:hypothetical protein PTZ02_13145 [Clostridium sp. 'White wine YQ']|nr:hypothetical protein [Clostridium sp. 'White wine YQ']
MILRGKVDHKVILDYLNKNDLKWEKKMFEINYKKLAKKLANF